MSDVKHKSTTPISNKETDIEKEKEIQRELQEAKKKFAKDLEKRVEELEKSGTYNSINYDDYMEGSTNYNTFMQFILGKLFIPSECGNTLRAYDYINSVTTFKYDPYDSPNVALQHSIPENVVLLNRLNKIFNDDIISMSSNNYHFDDIDVQICDFLGKNKDIKSTVLEYTIIKSFMGKMMISLSTSSEMALREKNVPLIDSQFKQAVLQDLTMMKKIQSENGKLALSWNKFIENLFGLGSDNFIYVHDNYTSLNKKLLVAYNNDFLTEILVANTLKCYFPSVSINYFYAIKSIYITSRLLTIYTTQLFEKMANGIFKSLETIMDEIHTIVSVGITIYENKNYIFKQMPRTLPSYKHKIEEKTEMYIINHIFTGGQYYLLKMFERSSPVLGNLILNSKKSTPQKII